MVLDLRKTSPFFGKWSGIVLSEENRKMLWIPPGFAHGFYVLSNNTEVLYKCTDYYSQISERCIQWNDPTIKIDWPIVQGTTPILSEKDKSGSTFLDADVFE